MTQPAELGPFKRALGHAFVGVIFGGMLGAALLHLLLPLSELLRIAAGLGLKLVGWQVTCSYAALGAVLGVIFEVPRGLVSDASKLRREAALRQRARRTGSGGPAVPAPDRVEALRPFFEGCIAFEAGNATRTRIAGIDVTTADVTCKTRGREGIETEEQTVACYQSEASSFPRFSLRPGGILAMVMSEVGGIRDIDFASHEGFSKAHYLSADVEDETRKLFNARVLEHLAGLPGLYIDSRKESLLMYWPNRLCGGADLQGFAAGAAEIFRLFEASARASGFTKGRVPPRRNMRALVDKMPGLIGMEARRTLVTRADLDAFLRQPAPRKVPPAILAYRDRFAPDFLPLLGVMFGGGGLAFMYGFGSQALYRGKGLFSSDVAGALMGLVFFALGAPMLFYGGRARYRSKRLLRHGRTASATIAGIESTGIAINGAEVRRLNVRYRLDGRDVQALCRVIGTGAERAQKLATEKKPATILYHPGNPQRILFADDLISLSIEDEP